MPYDGEYAHYKPLRRVVESTQVQNLLRRARVSKPAAARSMPPPVALADLGQSAWLPDWIIGVDGSMSEVPVDTGYPAAMIGYVTVASVMLNLAKMTALDVQRPVDPRKFAELEQAESVDGALPGSNVVIDDTSNAADSFRRALFEILSSRSMSDDCESLLDTYEALLKHKPPSTREPQQCPYGEDCLRPDRAYQVNHGEYRCGCVATRPLFSTDGLRIHESMQPDGSNKSMFTETMNVIERVWVIHILRTLEQKGWLTSLRRLAIILDGPLAVFGAPAWLSSAMQIELARLNRAAQVAIGDDQFQLLLIGVDKSGVFADHLHNLDQGSNGEGDTLPKQAALLLTGQYIKERIIFSNSDRDYGRNTYFGRKLFYKTASGALIVVTLPFLSEADRDLGQADPTQFPRLADAMYLLDKLVSAKYRNSVSTLISAHAEAAIPLHLGKRVLETLARTLLPPRSEERPK